MYAGLWTGGSGVIECPLAEDMFFLPQQPFMPLGTLRQQLLFPSGLLHPLLWLASSMQLLTTHCSCCIRHFQICSLKVCCTVWMSSCEGRSA